MNLLETIKSWFGTKEESKPTQPVKQPKGLDPKSKPNKKKKVNSGRRKKRN